MKKLVCLILTFIFLCSLTACSLGKESDISMVQIKEKGPVIETIVEEFDQSYYNIEELESVIQEDITEYNQNLGSENVKLLSCEEKEGKVIVKLEYTEAADYAAFNDIHFFSGQVSEAMSEGYDFSGPFYESESREEMDFDEENDLSDYHVVITDEALNVSTAGKILYTGGNVNLINSKLAGITQDIDNKEWSYIFYK